MRFVLGGRVCDRKYFRQQAAESRKHAAQKRTLSSHVARQSDAFPQPPAQLSAVPGLGEALNGLVGGPEAAAWLPLILHGFDLKRYPTHSQLHIGPVEVCIDDLPSIDSTVRMDRVWQFLVSALSIEGYPEIRSSPPPWFCVHPDADLHFLLRSVV